MSSRMDGRKRSTNVFSARRLPLDLTAELLDYMSEEGRFEQTLSQFPEMSLDELSQTFAWLATEVRKNVEQGAAAQDVQSAVTQYATDQRISPTTKKVLSQLSPEEGRALLRNFGALD